MPLLEIHQFDEFFRENNGFGIDFFPREKNQCQIRYFHGKIRQNDEFFYECESKIAPFLHCFCIDLKLSSVYLVNYVEILLPGILRQIF